MPGRIACVVREMFRESPDAAFKTEDIVRRCYPGISQIEHKHGVAVRRGALHRAPTYLRTPRCRLVFFNNASTKSQAAAIALCTPTVKVKKIRTGRTITSGGYVLIRVPKGTPGAQRSNRILEHRHIMQQKLGRTLARSELVHHRDGNRQNNDLSNLVLKGFRSEILATLTQLARSLREKERLSAVE